VPTKAWIGPIGGTSWAAPTLAAFVVEAAQRKSARLGWLNPRLYAAFKAHGYRVYRDITKGDNGIPAHPGFDGVTGLGSVMGYRFSGVL
jgi:kumamolisin